MGRCLLLLLLPILFLASCRSTRHDEPLPEPNVEIRIDQYSGSTFRGPTAATELPGPGEFQRVVVTFTVLERMPGDALDPITDHSELLLETGAGRLFLPAPRAIRVARVGLGPAAAETLRLLLANGGAGRTRKMSTQDAVVAAGTTAEFSLQEKQPSTLPHLRSNVYQALIVYVQLSESSNEYLLAFAGRYVAEPTAPLPSAGLTDSPAERTLSEQEAATLPAVRREAFLLSRATGSLPIVVSAILPAKFLDAGGDAVAVTVTVLAAPAEGSEDHAGFLSDIEDYRKGQADLAAQAEEGRLGDPIGRQLWTGLASALDGLSSPERTRSALAYVSRETTAWFAEDIALAAADPLVDNLRAEFLKRAADLPRPLQAEQLGFLLERTAYEMAFEFLRTRDAPPGAVGLLLRHTGEVGRHLSILQDVVDDATSLADLRSDLIFENLIFLEDGSPAARVRAYDWLTQNQEAPPGYDPLGSRQERRDAIAAFLEKKKRAGSSE